LEETERLNETIESLLLLSKAESTGSANSKTVFPASELVNEVLSLLQVLMEERHISISREGELIGRSGVRANRSLLRTALLNVLHNALKFSPNNSTLAITYSRSADPDPKLIMTFQDQGPGIAPGEHNRVFERFFTSAAQSTASQSGTGLGLSVTKLVIDRIGGEVWFDEEMQAGAKCIITLPISE